MRKLKWVAVLLLAIAAAPNFQATGRITDAKTGKPIEDATVFAVWYYHSNPIPVPFLAHGPSGGGDGCGDVAIVTTNADGEYNLGFWMNLQIRFRKSAVWTFAPGYYDIRQPRPFSTYWDKEGLLEAKIEQNEKQSIWLRALLPIDGESTNVRLIAMSRSGSPEGCGRSRPWIRPYSHNSKYNAAIQASLNSALCESRVLLDPPRTDVFNALFEPYRGMPKGWRRFVKPYLPVDDKKVVPPEVIKSACALLYPEVYSSSGETLRSSLRSYREITAINAETGEPVANLPIRIMWRRSIPSRYNRVEDIYAPSYGLHSVVTQTNEAGTYVLEINPEMVEEQLASDEGEISYGIVPYSNDYLAFSWKGAMSKKDCGMLLDETMKDSYGENFGKWLGRRSCERDTAERSEAERNLTNARLKTQSWTLPKLEDTSTYDELTRIAAAFQQVQRTSTKEWDPMGLRQIDSRYFNEIRAYQWKWPADALFARAYGLLDSAPALETFPEAFIKLQRDQVGTAFTRVCEEADESRVGDAYVVSRELWWVEAQTRGLDEANKSAQSRAKHFENGSRCFERNGRPYRPSAPGREPLSKTAACSMWQQIKEGLADPPFEVPTSFTDLDFDIQCLNR